MRFSMYSSVTVIFRAEAMQWQTCQGLSPSDVSLIAGLRREYKEVLLCQMPVLDRSYLKVLVGLKSALNQLLLHSKVSKKDPPLRRTW